MRIHVAPLKHRHVCRGLCRVPPSPEALTQLYARWQELRRQGSLPADMGFEAFYAVWRAGRRGGNLRGLDDGATTAGSVADKAAVERINRPPVQLQGVVRSLVLLVDFPDRPATGRRSASFYEQMLFSTDGVFPTGSMRDYYRLVSGFDAAAGRGVDVQGQVFGWFRLPQPSAFYAGGHSGMGEDFPRNAPGMVRDAVEAALAAGVDFGGLDLFGEGAVTALFVIHAGSGAETSGEASDIWSHKWLVPGGVDVAPDLQVTTYLTVPEDCAMGVCAHEWGHLAARWADYYDTGRVRHLVSAGLGDYCLMASGSWGQGGLTPVFPNGMLRMFHGWVDATPVTQSASGLSLRPAAEGGGMLFIQHPTRMNPSQYVVVEYRRQRGQDRFLPDQGVAVYVVDERVLNVDQEALLAIELLQADGRRDLAAVFGRGNRGDEGDLYPSGGRDTIGADTDPPLNLPGTATWSGITLKVSGTPGADVMTVDVQLD